ncbi:MAG: pyridoxamine 5'-phosphate oxidase [Bacteroidota bacterium]|nr:pyridoxamine 5'-phosphate oxidase [Bacteroidota bacterium]
MKKKVALTSFREKFTHTGLREDDLDPNPIRQFQQWFREAEDRHIADVNAMTLATASRGGIPSARIVLLKSFDERGFVFYTNHESEKGKELADNPNVALVFHWKGLERQVRINGTVAKIAQEESESYFHSRPRGSQLSAWASHQSEVVNGRDVLEMKMQEYEKKFKGKEIPCPPYWGGFCVVPSSMEFWQGRPNRLHDRLRYTLKKGRWIVERLSP